jgi:YegS/Rv2252/BmrU family lipid kinase
MRYTFLVNPAAKSGQAKKTWRQIKSYLESAKIDYVVKASEKAGDIQRWTKQFHKHEDLNDNILVIVGGDGTLNEALNGAFQVESENQLPLAYVPAGSGNDFARAHGLETDAIKRVKRIIAITRQGGRPELLDVGEYTEAIKREKRFFVNNVGIGFDATAVSAANSSVMKRFLNWLHLGKLVYLSAILKTLATQDRFQIEIQPSNGPAAHVYKGYLVTVSNHAYFGGGVKIMPDADPKDGLLDVIVVEWRNIFQFVLLFVKILSGKQFYNDAEVSRWTADAVTIKISRLEFGHADGEELGSRAYDLYVSTQKYPFWI